MSRPGFALSVLLVTFSGLLLVVSAANGQQLNSRVGGVKFGLCPFVGNELSDCGFGAHVCDVGYLADAGPEPSPCKSQPTSYWPLTNCCVSEWLREIPAKFRASLTPAAVQTPYLSGYDAAYDQAVYGIQPGASEKTTKSVTAKPVMKMGQECPLRAQPDWAGWDWYESQCGRCIMATPARAVTAAAVKPMEREPNSIEEYYSMYGGRRPVEPEYNIYADNYGYAPAVIRSTKISMLVKQWLTGSSMRAAWRTVQDEYESRRDGLVHRLMVSPYWPAIADVYRTWSYETAVSNRNRVAPVGVDRACGRVAVLAVARSLDEASSMLQNASRCLKQMVENPAVEISTTPDASDQR